MFKKSMAIAICSLALLSLGLPAARLALAAPAGVTFNVNSTLDAPDDSPGDGNCHTAPGSVAAGACTLRAAVMEADKASGAGATISMPAGIYSLTTPASGTDSDPSTGDLNLTAPASGNPLITISGAGAATTIIDANQIDRVLKVSPGRTAIVNGVTLRGGFLTEFLEGSGIYNAGNLTVVNSTLSGNQADPSASHGGGITNYGTLLVDQSSVRGNRADEGGGLYNFGVLKVTRSLVYGNSAGYGGGLENDGVLAVDRSLVYGNNATYGGGLYSSTFGSQILVNSTLSQNYAVTDGGGLYNFGVANIYNSTIVSNWADTDHDGTGDAGGIYSDSLGTVNLRNTLLAGNGAGDPRVLNENDCFGTLHAYGHNLFGIVGYPAPCTINTDHGSWDYVNSLAHIGPLQDNGGPTWTHALLTGSNAIDGADPVFGCTDENGQTLPTDQRGVVRALGARCDIGAFEALPPAAYLPLIRR